MGIRAIIDVVCCDKVGDCGGFQQKLDALVAGEFISTYQKDVLEAALEAGSAAVHRAYLPEPNVLEHLLDIVEHLLQGTYVLRDVAREIEQTTPKRKEAR